MRRGNRLCELHSLLYMSTVLTVSRQWEGSWCQKEWVVRESKPQSTARSLACPLCLSVCFLRVWLSSQCGPYIETLESGPKMGSPVGLRVVNEAVSLEITKDGNQEEQQLCCCWCTALETRGHLECKGGLRGKRGQERRSRCSKGKFNLRMK
jgi:hypothetical protein